MNAQERKQIADIADNEAWDEILKVLSEGESNYLIHLKNHENQTRILHRQRKPISESQSQRVQEDQKRALETKSVSASNYVDDRQNAFASQFAEIEKVEETVSEVDSEDLDPNDRDAFTPCSTEAVTERAIPKGKEGEASIPECDWEELDPNDRDAFFKKFSVFEPEEPKQNALRANTSPGTEQWGIWKCTVPPLEKVRATHLVEKCKA